MPMEAHRDHSLVCRADYICKYCDIQDVALYSLCRVRVAASKHTLQIQGNQVFVVFLGCPPH